MIVSEVMTCKPHIIGSDASLHDAANKMQATGCSILPVGTYEEIIGVVVSRDILFRLVSCDVDQSGTSVQSIMSTDIPFCYDDDSLNKAMHKMIENHMRRVLIFNRDRALVGILSVSDILRRVKNKSELINIIKE